MQLMQTADSHDLHESKLPFVSRIEFIRSKLSNFSAHVSGVSEPAPVAGWAAFFTARVSDCGSWRQFRVVEPWPATWFNRFVSSRIVWPCLVLSRLVSSRLVSSHPIPSHPIPSHPIPSRPSVCGRQSCLSTVDFAGPHPDSSVSACPSVQRTLLKRHDIRSPDAGGE